MVYCSRRVCSAKNWTPSSAMYTSGQVSPGLIRQRSAEHGCGRSDIDDRGGTAAPPAVAEPAPDDASRGLRP